MKISSAVNPSPVHSIFRIHSCFLYILLYPALLKANKGGQHFKYVNFKIPNHAKNRHVVDYGVFENLCHNRGVMHDLDCCVHTMCSGVSKSSTAYVK